MKYLSLVGQILEIIGAAILFQYGVPPYTPKYGGAVITYSGVTPEQKGKTKRYSKMNKIGFGFILIGFLLQGFQSVFNLQSTKS